MRNMMSWLANGIACRTLHNVILSDGCVKFVSNDLIYSLITGLLIATFACIELTRD